MHPRHVIEVRHIDEIEVRVPCWTAQPSATSFAAIFVEGRIERHVIYRGLAMIERYVASKGVDSALLFLQPNPRSSGSRSTAGVFTPAPMPSGAPTAAAGRGAASSSGSGPRE
jgi:hypothetical protein